MDDGYGYDAHSGGHRLLCTIFQFVKCFYRLCVAPACRQLTTASRLHELARNLPWGIKRSLVPRLCINMNSSSFGVCRSRTLPFQPYQPKTISKWGLIFTESDTNCVQLFGTLEYFAIFIATEWVILMLILYGPSRVGWRCWGYWQLWGVIRHNRSDNHCMLGRTTYDTRLTHQL